MLYIHAKLIFSISHIATESEAGNKTSGKTFKLYYFCLDSYIHASIHLYPFTRYHTIGSQFRVRVGKEIRTIHAIFINLIQLIYTIFFSFHIVDAEVDYYVRTPFWCVHQLSTVKLQSMKNKKVGEKNMKLILLTYVYLSFR